MPLESGYRVLARAAQKSLNSRCRPLALALALPLLLCACASTPVERKGPLQQTIVKRTYSTGLQDLRSAILAKFGRVPNSLPFPFREMHAIELKPPQYGPGWLEGWADGGGFLQTYKRIPAAEKLQDLYINEWTGDIYWPSEYFTLAGPAKFHCGFIVHLAEQAQNAAEVQVYEHVPTVWAGEHWEVSRHGIGFGKYHDIRFVEPTVKDRIDLLDLLGALASR